MSGRAAAMREMDRAAEAAVLALQRCDACGALQYPPRELCANCLADALAWQHAPDVAGEVLAVTVLHHSFDREMRDRLPLRVGLVRLAGGPSAVCFLDARCVAGDRVRVRAQVDAYGRAVLTASRLDGVA